MENLLPNNYGFVYGTQILATDIMKLRISIGWDPINEATWNTCISESIAAVGVAHNDVLIGIGFIAGNSRHAVLCDLTVNPDHQGKGLGKALLLERVRIADDKKIAYLYTDIAKSNPMTKLYSNLGFINSGNGLFRQSN